jgi:bifunctional non-homologous end joining protein LigD
MAKRKGSRYLPGRRSENWLKIKARMQQEAVIGGITEPSGGRHYFGALMLGVYDKLRLLYVGHTMHPSSRQASTETRPRSGPRTKC